MKQKQKEVIMNLYMLRYLNRLMFEIKTNVCSDYLKKKYKQKQTNKKTFVVNNLHLTKQRQRNEKLFELISKYQNT